MRHELNQVRAWMPIASMMSDDLFLCCYNDSVTRMEEIHSDCTLSKQRLYKKP